MTTALTGGCAAVPAPQCRAIVVIPARNEADSLPRALDALRRQTDLYGDLLDAGSYEVWVLLNNCTDDTAAIAQAYRVRYPGFPLYMLERTYPAEHAHVGTARRELMELACARLEASPNGLAVLSTDADTVCGPDWIAQNLACLEKGADAVGGRIELLPEDRDSLDRHTLSAYEQDALYQSRVAQLESVLDPVREDPWPRHLQHFGASLACTTTIYRRAGGMPAVTPLEDVAFVDALRRADARIRHSPAVQVLTSARLDGRAQVGLSGQLRVWRDLRRTGASHLVESAAWLEHRFRTLGLLRVYNEGRLDAVPAAPDAAWCERATTLRARHLSYASFLEQLDCDEFLEQGFRTFCAASPRHEEIGTAIERLTQAIDRYQLAPAHRA